MPRLTISLIGGLGMSLCLPATVLPAQVSERTGVVDRTIESLEEVPFGRISSITLSPRNGRLVVMDELSQRVHVLREDGSHAFSFGADGDGPREFRGACCLTVTDEGVLWVLSPNSNRLDRFTLAETTTTHEARVPFPQPPGATISRRNPAITPEGDILVQARWRSRPGGLTDQLGRLRLDSDGSFSGLEPVVEVPTDSTDLVVSRDERGRLYPIGLVVGTFARFAMGRNGHHAFTLTSNVDVTILSAEGHPVQRIRREVQALPLSPEDEAANRERRQLAEEYFGLPIVQDPTPRFRPVVADVWYDTENRLWIELTTNNGEEDREAFVYDLDGEMLFEARWPAGIDLSQGAASARLAWGVIENEWGEQTLVRLTFR